MMEQIAAIIPNLDAVTLALATGLATGIVTALRELFSLARRLAAKTKTTLDDNMVDEMEKSVHRQQCDR